MNGRFDLSLFEGDAERSKADKERVVFRSTSGNSEVTYFQEGGNQNIASLASSLYAFSFARIQFRVYLQPNLKDMRRIPNADPGVLRIEFPDRPHKTVAEGPNVRNVEFVQFERLNGNIVATTGFLVGAQRFGKPPHVTKQRGYDIGKDVLLRGVGIMKKDFEFQDRMSPVQIEISFCKIDRKGQRR